MFRVLAISLLAATLCACGPDAQEVAARKYVEDMTPLLKRNAELSSSFLDLAALIKKKKATPQSVADTLRDEMIPHARELLEGVEAVQPQTESLSQIHTRGLVRAWKNRVSAYERMQSAWESGDATAFESAASDHQTVFKAEERYFKTTDTLLGEYQLKLVRYP